MQQVSCTGNSRGCADLYARASLVRCGQCTPDCRLQGGCFAALGWRGGASEQFTYIPFVLVAPGHAVTLAVSYLYICMYVVWAKDSGQTSARQSSLHACMHACYWQLLFFSGGVSKPHTTHLNHLHALCWGGCFFRPMRKRAASSVAPNKYVLSVQQKKE